VCVDFQNAYGFFFHRSIDRPRVIRKQYMIYVYICLTSWSWTDKNINTISYSNANTQQIVFKDFELFQYIIPNISLVGGIFKYKSPSLFPIVYSCLNSDLSTVRMHVFRFGYNINTISVQLARFSYMLYIYWSVSPLMRLIICICGCLKRAT